MPLLVEQPLAIGLARRPITLSASHVDLAALPAAADAESLIRVNRRSPDQRRLREDRVARREISGRQQVPSEIGIVTYLPGVTRGPVTRPVLSLVRSVAVKFAPAVATLQRGVFTANWAHTVARSGLHGQLISEIISVDLTFSLDTVQILNFKSDR